MANTLSHAASVAGDLAHTVLLPRLPEEARHRRAFEMVEALQEHPRDPNQILIGYSRGLVVIWDLQGSRVLSHFLSSQVGVPPSSPQRPPDTSSPCLRQGAQAMGLPPDPSPRALFLLSRREATGKRLLAAGQPPDRQLPFRRQLLPVARGQQQPAAGAPAQLCALRSVLCPPPGASRQ